MNTDTPQKDDFDDLQTAIEAGDLITHCPNTGKPYVMPMPRDFVESEQQQQHLQAAAKAQLDASITNTPEHTGVLADTVSINSVRDAKILERILGGASKRVVARELGLSEAAIEKIVYMPENRQRLADCVSAMNEQMANDVQILVQQATSQLSDMLTSGDYTRRLATIDKVVGLWIKLNSIATHNQPKTTQTRTVKSNGIVDKMTVTA
jgi:hypothetical protein